MAPSVFMVMCATFLLWAQFKSTTADDQMPEGAAVQHFTENSSGLAGSVAEGHLATPMPKHRFSSMLSAAKKLTKAGACSLPDDPYVDLALDHFGSNLPVTKIISIPVTEFSCNDRKPGYYADRDREASCKIFHYCYEDNPIVSFICPTCTLFHDEKQLCDYWYNVDCKVG
ncbi:uncharacterized protein LOC124350811 [Daphnia pulicaria]|uniref:uncharacterized protein LOC124350811 n=1 Tax=Daphnia pulicaria TaxID=35523 RepID=UPI001EEA22A1|nr:uncharacterized protein LOC124350811 [Daphnia pulicaria]